MSTHTHTHTHEQILYFCYEIWDYSDNAHWKELGNETAVSPKRSAIVKQFVHHFKAHTLPYPSDFNKCPRILNIRLQPARGRFSVKGSSNLLFPFEYSRFWSGTSISTQPHKNKSHGVRMRLCGVHSDGLRRPVHPKRKMAVKPCGNRKYKTRWSVLLGMSQRRRLVGPSYGRSGAMINWDGVMKRFFQHRYSTTYVWRIYQGHILWHKFVTCLEVTGKWLTQVLYNKLLMPVFSKTCEEKIFCFDKHGE